VTDVSLLEADDEATKLRQAKPLRHMATKDASLRLRAGRSSLPGDDKNERHAIGVGVMQKIQQRAMGSRLRHAMEIETRIDIFSAA
jgi:hypothetical protein